VEDAPRPIAPVAMKVVEILESDMKVQRGPVKLFTVGTRVKVITGSCGQLYEDGVVIDLLESDGERVRAGSVKVWYNGGRTVKLFSPQSAKVKLIPFELGTCPPLLPFGAVGQLSETTNLAHTPKYVELHGGYLNWWDRYDDAKRGKPPSRSLRLDTTVQVVLDSTNDEFIIKHDELIQAKFSVRGTQFFDTAEVHGKQNDRLRWMWTFAFMAQVDKFSVEYQM